MTADAPISPGRMQTVLRGLSGRDIRQAIDDLNEKYRQGGHAMSVVEIAGGFQVATRKEFGPWVRKLHDKGRTRLTQAGLETLAIIAFKQPLTRMEVDSIRGVESGGVIRTLLEASMIRLVGRSEGVGRPMLFGTTREFMSHFGLKSLADLPKPKELQELLAQGGKQGQIDDGTLEESPEAADGALEESVEEADSAGEESAGAADETLEEALEDSGSALGESAEAAEETLEETLEDAGGALEESAEAAHEGGVAVEPVRDDDVIPPSDSAPSGA